MRDEGVTVYLIMSLVIHLCIGDVQDSQGVSASEIAYIVSCGALDSTHSLLYPDIRTSRGQGRLFILLFSFYF